ncbi:hypothetical protein ANCDUO_10591 [Ancylostoma duodenale]|uniref:Reverse transcriptase RNase H-like domain-containing protein n=1 Tax=Ancylostoma duodenale TaxID=51022 RepID=A0A0C2DA56_9BILA|nr:hypothetical protein ANCDUO_10591 [Ancylostoma duodenale]
MAFLARLWVSLEDTPPPQKRQPRKVTQKGKKGTKQPPQAQPTVPTPPRPIVTPQKSEMFSNHEDTKDISLTRRAMDHQQVYQACKMIGNRIEKFSGTGDRTFEEFLEEYTDLIARFSIPHDVARRLLPLYLSVGAKLKYQTIENHDQLPWDDLVTQLAKKLKSEALLSNLRDELHNMTQGKDSVGEFAKKVYTKTKIAFQGQGDGTITRMATDFFIKGLNPEIRKAIRRLPETDEFDAIVCRAEKEFRILEQERKEDRDAVQAINALISDEKINRLEQQLNRMKVNRRRPPTPMPPRQRNRPPISNKDRPTTGNSFNSQPLNFPRRPNNISKPKKQVTWYNPFRNYRANRTRFAAQQFQPCNCPTHGCQQNMTHPQPSAPHYVPMYQQPSTSSMMPTTTANLLCLVLTLIASAVAQYQVCGTNLYGNTFSLPDVVDCTVPSGTAMLRTTIQLYTEQSHQIVLNATKCYKEVLEVSISNFLYIRTLRTILNRRRVSIPQGLCQTARITGKVHGHDLIQVLPGLQTTNEIEEENTTLPLWGTNKYIRSIYSIETGQVASFDGNTIISSLANLENCTLSDGVCIRRDGIVVWEPVHSAPLCRFTAAGSFEALVTMQHIVLPHSDVVLQFSSDYLLHVQLTEQCKTLGNSYLTTSNHIVTFPYIPQDIMIQDYILRMTHRRRVKRYVPLLSFDDNLTFPRKPSRTLNKHEARYPAIELEALGLVYAVQKFRPYIDGAKCTVITDHAPLKALLHRQDLTGRLAKYQIVLQEFDIQIIYRPGKKNIVCDTLSRHMPTANTITTIQPNNLHLENIQMEQDQCPWIAEVK